MQHLFKMKPIQALFDFFFSKNKKKVIQYNFTIFNNKKAHKTIPRNI